MDLFTYFRSSASYRVRIALNLKGVLYESHAVNLKVGEQHAASFSARNPQKSLPFMCPSSKENHRGAVPNGFGQSLVMLEYLEHFHPAPPLLPPVDDPMHWKARDIASYIACDIHPLNNLKVLQYLKNTMGVDDEVKMSWYFHWLKEGFDTLEAMLSTYEGPYALGKVSWVDVCLVPQIYNARRFHFDMKAYPRLCAIETHCLQQKPFQDAVPEAQKDCDL